MPEVTLELNYLAIIVAAAANFVLGMVWYAPSVFGKMWMKEAGITMGEMTAEKKAGDN